MKKLGKGSTIVGFLDEKLHFNLLKDIDFSNKKIIYVIGTNGKTTTTNALYDLYSKNNHNVISNLQGANLASGIRNLIIMNLKGKNLEEDILLLEVDEKNVKLLCEKFTPDDVIITNFFRDQLDRYFEIDITIREIIKAIEPFEPNVYINGQDPLLTSFFEKTSLNLIKFSLNNTVLEDSTNVKEIKYCSKCSKKLKYNFFHYAHIGEYYCESCDFKVKEINNHFEYRNNTLSYLEDSNISLSFNSNTPLYLIINFCAILNFGIYNKLINSHSLKTLENFSMPKGRNNNIVIKNKEVYLTLAKNVVGMEQTINYLLETYEKIDLLIAFNDNYADSRDVSWIWDIDFAKLIPIINSLHIVGKRKGAMELRFLYENVQNIKTYETIEHGIDQILKYDTPIIISNYTPLSTINKYLKEIS